MQEATTAAAALHLSLLVQLDARDGVLQHGDDVRPAQAEGAGDVAEGLHGEDFTHGDLAGVDAAADAAAIHVGDLRAGFLTDGVRDEVTEVAFLYAADTAIAFQHDCRFTNHAVSQFGDGFLQAGDQVGDVRRRCDVA